MPRQPVPDDFPDVMRSLSELLQEGARLWYGGGLDSLNSHDAKRVNERFHDRVVVAWIGSGKAALQDMSVAGRVRHVVARLRREEPAAMLRAHHVELVRAYRAALAFPDLVFPDLGSLTDPEVAAAAASGLPKPPLERFPACISVRAVDLGHAADGLDDDDGLPVTAGGAVELEVIDAAGPLPPPQPSQTADLGFNAAATEEPQPRYTPMQVVCSHGGQMGIVRRVTKHGARGASATRSYCYDVLWIDGAEARRVPELELLPETLPRTAAPPPAMPSLSIIRERARLAVEAQLGGESFAELEARAAAQPLRARGTAQERPATRACGDCGGDLLLTNVTTADGRNVVINVPGDRGVMWDGSRLSHGTLNRHDVQKRRANNKAHASIVAQTSAKLVRLTKGEAAALKCDFELAFYADITARGSWWADAPIVEASIAYGRDPAETHPGRQTMDPATMRRIGYDDERVLVVNAETGMPAIASFPAPLAIGERGRAHFEPLIKHKFDLDRVEKHLAMDGPGYQRMEMVGQRSSPMNSDDASRPVWQRPGLVPHVANVDGDVDVYTRTLKRWDYWYGKGAMPIYDGMATHMLHVTPCLSAYMQAVHDAAEVERRSFLDLGSYLTEAKLFGHVGVSSAYWAPPHDDDDDVGFT